MMALLAFAAIPTGHAAGRFPTVQQFERLASLDAVVTSHKTESVRIVTPTGPHGKSVVLEIDRSNGAPCRHLVFKCNPDPILRIIARAPEEYRVKASALRDGKGIVRFQDGRVGILSRPPKGATCEMWIPAQKLHDAAEPWAGRLNIRQQYWHPGHRTG